MPSIADLVNAHDAACKRLADALRKTGPQWMRGPGGNAWFVESDDGSPTGLTFKLAGKASDTEVPGTIPSLPPVELPPPVTIMIPKPKPTATPIDPNPTPNPVPTTS